MSNTPSPTIEETHWAVFEVARILETADAWLKEGEPDAAKAADLWLCFENAEAGMLDHEGAFRWDGEGPVPCSPMGHAPSWHRAIVGFAAFVLSRGLGVAVGLGRPFGVTDGRMENWLRKRWQQPGGLNRDIPVTFADIDSEADWPAVQEALAREYAAHASGPEPSPAEWRSRSNAAAQPAPVADGPAALTQGHGWADVTLTLKSDDVLNVAVGAKSKDFHFATLGFQDGRNPERKKSAWTLLVAFIENDGTIPYGKQEACNLTKAVSDLRRALRRTFSIEADPIPFDDGHYCMGCHVKDRRGSWQR